MKEVCICARTASAYATTNLMQLSKAKQVGALNDKCVHGWHVDAAFNDGGAHQNIKLAFPEIDHDLLEAAFVHLAVRNCNACLWNEFA